MFLVASLTPLAAQDSPDVPKDSLLVTLNGCARNGSFIVGERREDQPGTLEIQPGRRFRMKGPKNLLTEIRARQRGVMQLTGLVRQSDVRSGSQGIGLLGGRVRIGGARVPQEPIANPARDPNSYQPVLDVRSWKSMTGDCR